MAMKKILLEVTVKTHLSDEGFADVLYDVLWNTPTTFEVTEIKVKKDEDERLNVARFRST